MVAVSLFRERVFTGGTIAVLMWGFGLFGIYFFTSLYLQNVLGFSPTEAGRGVRADGAADGGRARSCPRRRRREIGGANLVGFAMLLMAVGIASVSLLGRHASYLDLMPSFAVIGIGGGLSVTLTAMVLGAMPESEAGVASGIFNASREVAGLLGITVIGAILTARQSAASRAGHDAVDSFLSGYRAGLLVAAVLVAAGGVAAFLALRGARTATQLTADEREVAELELAG